MLGGRSSLGSLGAQLGASAQSTTPAADPTSLCVVGSYQPTIDVAGSYQSIVDVAGSYQPTIDVVGSWDDC